MQDSATVCNVLDKAEDVQTSEDAEHHPDDALRKLSLFAVFAVIIAC